MGIVKFLLLQALAFRGHDESTSSMNKGNFRELLDLFIKKDPKVDFFLEMQEIAINRLHMRYNWIYARLVHKRPPKSFLRRLEIVNLHYFLMSPEIHL